MESFQKFILDFDTNLFPVLSKITEFEQVTKGRKGAVIAHFPEDIVPIVRTTTSYKLPLQKFLPVHYDIIDKIKKKVCIDNLEFNNAMIEIYDSSYRDMKFHSDQALDLVDDSYIGIFSCYKNGVEDLRELRKLKICEKFSEKSYEVALENNSLVLFSVKTNRKHLHKIFLNNTSENNWLGITFRLSKTYVQYADNLPYFYPNGKLLRCATKEEEKEFFKLKKMENDRDDFIYPNIDYMIGSL
jgi:hypothetical protein